MTFWAVAFTGFIVIVALLICGIVLPGIMLRGVAPASLELVIVVFAFAMAFVVNGYLALLSFVEV
jgi:hypothetical protein